MCCGAKPPNVIIQVDHIKPRSKYPDLAYDPKNLQVLCRDCNKGKYDRFEDDFRPESGGPDFLTDAAKYGLGEN